MVIVFCRDGGWMFLDAMLADAGTFFWGRDGFSGGWNVSMTERDGRTRCCGRGRVWKAEIGA